MRAIKHLLCLAALFTAFSAASASITIVSVSRDTTAFVRAWPNPGIQPIFQSSAAGPYNQAFSPSQSGDLGAFANAYAAADSNVSTSAIALTISGTANTDISGSGYNGGAFGYAGGGSSLNVSFEITTPCSFSLNASTAATLGGGAVAYVSFTGLSLQTIYIRNGESTTVTGTLAPGRYNFIANEMSANSGQPNLPNAASSSLSFALHVQELPPTIPPVSVASVGGGSFVVSFATESGVTYQLQHSNDLAAWSDVGGALAGNGNTRSISDTRPGDKAFWRVAVSR